MGKTRQAAVDQRSDEGQEMRVECTDCRFEKSVSTAGTKLPAEFVIEHGQSTGHSLNLVRLEEE